MSKRNHEFDYEKSVLHRLYYPDTVGKVFVWVCGAWGLIAFSIDVYFGNIEAYSSQELWSKSISLTIVLILVLQYFLRKYDVWNKPTKPPK